MRGAWKEGKGKRQARRAVRRAVRKERAVKKEKTGEERKER